MPIKNNRVNVDSTDISLYLTTVQETELSAYVAVHKLAILVCSVVGAV